MFLMMFFPDIFADKGIYIYIITSYFAVNSPFKQRPVATFGSATRYKLDVNPNSKFGMVGALEDTFLGTGKSDGHGIPTIELRQFGMTMYPLVN